MNEQEFNRALETVVETISNDTSRFGKATLAIAGAAGRDREKLEQIKIWTDTLERVVYCEETENISANLTKHIDQIKNDRSVSSCVVFFSDGKDCVFYRHGDSEEICLGIETIVKKDKSGGSVRYY